MPASPALKRRRLRRAFVLALLTLFPMLPAGLPSAGAASGHAAGRPGPGAAAGQNLPVDPEAPPTAVAIVNETGERITYDIVDGMAVIDHDIILGYHDDIQENGISALEIGPPPVCTPEIQCGVIQTSSRRAWPNGVVPYTLAPGTSSTAAANVANAIEHFEAKTSIRFVPRTNETDYVEFVGTGNGNICSSWLGRAGGRQAINYAGNGRGCLVHEIGHAVGLSHEHNRNDRDNYIEIDYTNISGNAASQFRKATSSTDVGVYDFNSVMHYSAFSFAIDRSRPVIIPLDGRDPRTIGGRELLTASDVEAVEFVYGGNTPPPTTTTTRPTTTTTRPTTTRPTTTTSTTRPTTTETRPTTTTSTTRPTTTETRPTTTTSTTRPTTTETRPTTTTSTTRPTTTETRPTTTTSTTRPTTTETRPTTTTSTTRPTTTETRPTTTTSTTRPTTTETRPSTTTSTTAPTTASTTTTTIGTTTTIPPGTDRKAEVRFTSVSDGDTVPTRVPYGGINVVAFDPDAGSADGDGIRWVTLVLHDAETGRFLGFRREYWSTYDWGLRLRSGRSYVLTAYAVSERSAGGGWSRTSVTITAE